MTTSPSEKIWAGRRCFLLLEKLQFDRFEQWVRLGLIHAEFPAQSDDEDALNGASGRLGCLPVSLVPVQFDVQIEVGLTEEEAAGLVLDANSELGWLCPGIVPVHRVLSVRFDSMKLLEAASSRLQNGAVVPEVLNAYCSNWSAPDREGLSQDECVVQLKRLEQEIPEAADLSAKIKVWEKAYGHLSFLMAIDSAIDGVSYSAVALNHIVPSIRDTWPELANHYDDLKESLDWSDRKWALETFGILEEAIAFGTDAPDAPQILSQAASGMSKRMEQEVLAFWQACDCWWGSRRAENLGLIGPIEGIAEWMRSEQFPLEARTEALVILSSRAMRLKYDEDGEPGKPPRTRNFDFEGNEVVMTSKPSDAMNVIVAECCWARVAERKFVLADWLKEGVQVEASDVLCCDSNEMVLFGMHFTVRTENSLPSFWKHRIDSISDEKAQLKERITQLEKEIEVEQHESRKLKEKVAGLPAVLEKTLKEYLG